MDTKAKIEQEMDRLFDALAKMDPGSEEYKRTQMNLENYMNLLLEDERLEMDRIDKTHNRDLREQEIDERVADSKRKARSTFWAAVVGVLGTGIAVLGALTGQRELKETKEDQGVVDRDEFSMVRSMYPKP